MRCLWIGRDCPYPADSGDTIYSSHLLESFRDAGATITAVCRARDGHPSPALAAGVTWRVATGPIRSARSSLLRRVPNIARRHDTPSLQATLAAELAHDWDVILFDHIGAGWALAPVLEHVRGAPATKVVYLSQNHEASTRVTVARNAPANPVSRAVLRLDARKAATFERALVAASDLVTVVTEDDRLLFEREAPDTPCLVLMPGYVDRVVEERTITADVARRAVIVGSFDWIAKRINLEEFVAAADPLFAVAGAELLVVGRGPEAWLDQLRARSTATRFTGFVESVIPYLDDARIGIVAERSGGGFKLKVLHYVFNRLPVAAVAGSMAGLPLVPGTSDVEAPTLAALAETVVDLLDDLDELDRLQQRAFEACRGRFDWASRGRALFDTIGGL